MAKADQIAKQHEALILAPFLDIATEDGSALASFMAHCGIDVATSKAPRDQILDHYRLIVRLRHVPRGFQVARVATTQPSPAFHSGAAWASAELLAQAISRTPSRVKFRAPGPSISLHHSCQQ